MKDLGLGKSKLRHFDIFPSVRTRSPARTRLGSLEDRAEGGRARNTRPLLPPGRHLCIVAAAALTFSARASEMSRVYIGRLSYRARENDVERFFKGYGKILEVDLKNG